MSDSLYTEARTHLPRAHVLGLESLYYYDDSKLRRKEAQKVSN